MLKQIKKVQQMEATLKSFNNVEVKNCNTFMFVTTDKGSAFLEKTLGKCSIALVKVVPAEIGSTYTYKVA